MIEYKAKDWIPRDSKIAIAKKSRTVHFKAHIHDFVELVYIVSGKCMHSVNGVCHEVEQGHLLYIGVGETHAFWSDSEVECYEIYARPEFIQKKLLAERPDDILFLSLYQEFGSELSDMLPCVHFQGEDMTEIENLLGQILREYSGTAPGKDAVIKGYFLVLITKFLRKVRKDQMRQVDRQLEKVMPEIIQYIENNYCKSLSLEELAEKSFYNPSYFSRIFKELYGKTFTEYITEKRIRQAVQLLEDTPLTIEAICTKVGYRDKKHFYKMFKQKMGLTPGEYRREAVLQNTAKEKGKA